ncbi:hypothetical protein CGT96_03550 [Vibrio metoecus]|nr:hypothetical protein CGT97_09950 [Vibrio metoecus]PAR44170.1 hypothetical protein CGT96_03550 [Vibrio metoecus]
MRWLLMVLLYKFSFLYLLVFSVVAFDNGQRFQVSEWLFFINANVAYGLLFYMVAISTLFFLLELKRTVCNVFFFTFYLLGVFYVIYSTLYGANFSYISYKQIGFLFIATSFLFLLDVGKWKTWLLSGYCVLLFFSLAMSLIHYYDLDLPIARYSDLSLDSTVIRASSGLLLQTNASGAFFCLSALVFLSLYNYSKNNIYFICCLISVLALLVGKSLGPIFILVSLSVFYANKTIILSWVALLVCMLVYKFDYFVYYLNYKIDSGSSKFDVFVGTVNRFINHGGDFLFGQFYSGAVDDLLYTESSMLDLFNNYGVIGGFWVFVVGISGVYLSAQSEVKSKFALFTPVFALVLLSLTQNSTLMLVHIFIITFYLSALHSMLQGETEDVIPLRFKNNA